MSRTSRKRLSLACGCVLIICAAFALVCARRSAADATRALSERVASSFVAEGDARKPFALELPELGALQITAPEALIPTTSVRTLRLRVREPFAAQINYGKIFTTVNGESAGTIQTVKRGADGYIVTCDLADKERFRLRPGKNVAEITATARDGKVYYASYVLIADRRAKGVKTSGGAAEDETNGATVEYETVGANDKNLAPKIYLNEPRGAVKFTGGRMNLRVAGVAVGASAAPVSVKVDSKAATLSAAAQTRGIGIAADEESNSAAGASAKFDAAKAVAFASEIVVDETTMAVIVEARDAAGNLTRVSVPVRRRTAAVSKSFRGRKFALIVGVSKYKFLDGGLNNLAYADADARAVRAFLLKPEGGGFAQSDVLLLENEAATLDAVRDALTHFITRAAPDDLLFIFFAGHGAPDPYAPQNLYFILHDTKIADMPRTALPMSEVREALDTQVRAERVVVFIDTCHSAGLSGEKLTATRGVENNLINLYAARLFNERGRAVLTSADVNELSREAERWGGGHGVFTWALLEGLRGEADANGDQIVTAGELFDFVRDRVRLETAFRQNPRALPGTNVDLPLSFAAKR